MDDAKKKKLDARLKQLIAEAEKVNTANEAPQAPTQRSASSGNVSVIRRRKGKPDHEIKT